MEALHTSAVRCSHRRGVTASWGPMSKAIISQAAGT